MSMSERITTDRFGRTVFVTADGDTVDQVARFYYGRHSDNTEAIYQANARLSGLSLRLPAGKVILLPDRPQTPTSKKPVLELWD